MTKIPKPEPCSIFTYLHFALTIVTLLLCLLLSFFYVSQQSTYSKFLPKLKNAQDFYSSFDSLLNDEVAKLVGLKYVEHAKKLESETEIQISQINQNFKNLTLQNDKNFELIQTLQTEIDNLHSKLISNFEENFGNFSQVQVLSNQTLQVKNQVAKMTKNFENLREKFSLDREKSMSRFGIFERQIKNMTAQIKIPGPAGPPGPAGKDGTDGKTGPKGAPGVDLINCYHDKSEKLATKSVKYLSTKWIKPKVGYIFTGVTCSTNGRQESFLEVKNVGISDDNLFGKIYRCNCGNSGGSVLNLLANGDNGNGSLTSCVMNFWSCPMYEISD